jgi:hypothetical protein
VHICSSGYQVSHCVESSLEGCVVKGSTVDSVAVVDFGTLLSKLI